MTHIILNILFIIHWKPLVPTEHYHLDFYGVIYSRVKFKKTTTNNPLLEPSEIALRVATYDKISIFIHKLHSLSKIADIYFLTL